MHVWRSAWLGAAGIAVALTLAPRLAPPATARPDYLVRFQADPLRRAGVDGCGSCHVNTSGGGARNDFGTAFDGSNREITPLLRANFPSHFDVPTAKLADGSTFFFSDPTSRFVVFERADQKVAVNLAEVATPKVTPLPAPANRMTFFVTSAGAPRGGHLGGLAGADRQCQILATAAGAGDLVWRAYLSTSFQGQAAVSAGDRIGGGPWFNAAGAMVARGPVDLHSRTRLEAELLMTEQGEPVAAADALLVFTGTQPNGMAAVDRNCNNWTSAAGGDALAGNGSGAWNSGRTASCEAAAGATPVRLYCFAQN